MDGSLLIIEHVWARSMTDVLEAVDPSRWTTLDLQPLSLEESWRLRVASAQLFSIVRSRDMQNFERAVGLLEATHTLLPALVAAIKHMKIVFGLKTMIVMWMLKEGRGMIDTVAKIGQLFPNKLPQYQDRCSKREMFLMRKNHLDFKSLAQTLAIDKDRLEDYIKNQMEEQYGERYAQKVEDRLLHYLQELESILPEETSIDQLLKKQSPLTEEEKLLLKVIGSDSTTIASALRKLLRCDVAICHETGWNLSKDSPLSDVGEHQLPDEDGGTGKRVEVESSDQREVDSSQTSCDSAHGAASPPQFCSRHQRWVRSILRGCPDECSEELLQQDVSSSPLLFQSSSSISSSQDLTPSDLVPCAPDQPPSQPCSHLQTSEPTNPGDKQSSASPETKSDASQTEHLPQSLSRGAARPASLLPVVQLVDIASSWWSSSNSKYYQVSPNCFSMFSNKQSSSKTNSSLQCCDPGFKDSVFVHPEMQKAPVSQDIPASSRCTPATPKAFSKPSWMFCTMDVLDSFVPPDTRHSQRMSPCRSETLPKSTVLSSTSDVVPGRSEPSDVQRDQLSLPSVAAMLQSSWLQPYLTLTRLSTEKCLQVTEGRAAATWEEPQEENADSSFDADALYWFISSSSDSDDSLDSDPNYKPRIKRTSLGV
ncbi:uncharacterized protein LOC133443931 [Cololabis saira]|uniref:uncharacterized protein LOC133443931 n=1 Tax=Cololabis saira TaxID=129043 RepID=UPI002AD2450A|nr:uncharacterized protein LOC133443931 [Cololabis saira]